MLGALALAMLAALAAAAQPVSGGRVTGARAHADLDGDRIFDDLETRAAHLASRSTSEAIVRLRSPATRMRIAALRRRIGHFAVTQRFTVVHGFAAHLTKRQIEALARAPSVVRLEPVVDVRGLNDRAQLSFGVAKARLDAPWLDGDRDGDPARYTSQDVVVAILDSGVDVAHPDLDGGKVIHFEDFVNGRPDASPYDDNGHGTHVAGIVAGTGEGTSDRLYRGVAPGAAIVAVKVLDQSRQGRSSDVMHGIEWVYNNAATYNIRVLNLSFEAGSPCGGRDSLTDLVDRIARDKGVLVTVAAGNHGPGPCSIANPGLAANALTVGAMADTSEGGFRLAPFSSRGPTSDGRVKPDVVAPGVGITSAGRCESAPACSVAPSYTSSNGTSMAGPFAAGVAALMLDANPGLTGSQLKTLLMQTAVDWGRGADNVDPAGRGADVDYGAGRLDAYAALAAAGAPLSGPPPAPAHDVRSGALAAAGAYADHRIIVTGTEFPLAATAIAPGTSGLDVDVALYSPSGAELARAGTSGRQEDLSAHVTVTGTYTLRVTAKSGSGGYFVDVSGAVTALPANQAPPTVAGEAREGSVLSAEHGRWSGGTPISFAYEWLRCDGSGIECAPIAAATGPTYRASVFDVGARLRVAVTASNAAGSATAIAGPTAAIAALPPTNVAAPVLVGRAVEGQALSARPGEWRSAHPPAFAFAWRRCLPSGRGCEPIAGATGSVYRLRALDTGHRVGVVVTATSAAGSTTAASTTLLVEARAPRLAARPRIVGRARVGSRLRATRGRWLATAPLRYSWRWSRCDRAGKRCVPIRRIRSNAYRLRAADAGRRIRVRVFASNGQLPGGALRSAASRATRVVRR